MPRKPRFFLPEVPVHAIVRGNNKQVIFAEDVDKEKYLQIATEAAASQQVLIHAYVLMDNHVHWLISSSVPENISKFMQYLGRKYVPYFNRKYEKTGTLWEGRFKASLINADDYLLTCYQYIELNPVRAGMVSKPEDYAWSSYRANALNEINPLVTPHLMYQLLGRTSQQRAEAYLDGFKNKLEEVLINDIRNAVQTGTPLGKNRFKEQVEALLGVKVGHAKQGRPRKTRDL